MENIRLGLTEIAKGMTRGEIEYLRKLRKAVVDLDLPSEAARVDNALFLALYLSKRLTGDVWENLATDASFEFDEEKLTNFTALFGEMLEEVLSESFKNQPIVQRLGELTRWLYLSFYKVSLDPSVIAKGGQNELTRT